MTQVKICGIRRVDDALVATEAGADLLGFVFFEGSRRRIEPEEARDIIAAVRERSEARAVGVFVNAEPARMNHVARVARLDFVQLSGDEPDELAGMLDVPAIQVVHVREGMAAEALIERIGEAPGDLVMLDAAQPGVYGGTGRTFDWGQVPQLDRNILLAGGLHAGNVGDAVRRVRPWGVDASSGVETNGRKDHDRIRKFLRAAKSTE